MPLPKWLHETFEAFTSIGIFEGVKYVLTRIGDHTSPMDVKYIMYRVTGRIPLGAEHVIERANAELSAENHAYIVAAEQKYVGLASHQQDYIRLVKAGYHDPTLTREENERYRIDAAKEITRFHARMTDDEWADYVQDMNYDFERLNGRYERFVNFLRTDAPGFIQAFYAGVRAVGIDVYAALGRMSRDTIDFVWPIIQSADEETDRWAVAADNYIQDSALVASARRINEQHNRPGFRGTVGRFFGIV